MFEFIAKYAPQLIMAGIKYTVPLALISFVIAVIIAAIVAAVVAASTGALLGAQETDDEE